MKIRLKYWQILLLFLPAIVGFIIIDLPYRNQHTNQLYFRTANFLHVLTMCLVICYQAYLGISFNNQLPSKSNLFNFNAFISIAFNITYIIDVIYYTFVKPVHSNLSVGPLHRIDFNLITIIITFFLFQAAISFFFINNSYVSRRIKMLADVTEQGELEAEFLAPMKNLVKNSLLVIAGSLILSVIVDLIRFSNH